MNILDNFKKLMSVQGIDYFCIKDADEHNSEYVSDEFKFRTLLSGFSGSNGLLIIGLEKSYLFTDGRYFIQAIKELKDTGIKLMKLNTPGYPSVKEFINELVESGAQIGYNPYNFSYKELKEYNLNYPDISNDIYKKAYNDTFGIQYESDSFDTTFYIVDDKLAGVSVSDKIVMIRKKINEIKRDFVLVSALDSVMWIYNIRGKAVKYNPVACSYGYISDNEAVLFIKNPDSDTNRVYSERLRQQGIDVIDYGSFINFINTLKGLKGCVDESTLCAYVGNILKSNQNDLLDNDAGISLMKCIKNETEIANIKKVYIKDSKIVSEFLKYVENLNVNTENEYTLACKLDEMRLSDKDCFDLSFDTISAFGPNGAMMHYEATKDSYSEISTDNLYLVDSGGQWIGGTTDITRTVSLGEPSYEMKHDYTLVLRGLLNLQNAVFIEGLGGRNLDTFARAPLWREFSDYKCGTGHGIGYMLNVHEGPFSISKSAKDTCIKPGMIVSDEPGIYKENKYGIRLENILLCVKKGENEGDVYLGFEPLTFVAFDEKLILRDEMTEDEIKWLNEYQSVCKSICC